jgi:hypothetical protein
MKNDKPISHDTHVYDKLARQNLERVFPIHWKLTRPDDFNSGTDYGQDWLVLLTDDNNKVTGAEFRVQSKTLDGEIEGDTIKISGVNLKTINYLIDIPLPVLIHAYHRGQNQGYWIWLKEWYVKNYNEGWKEQETLTISIPTSSLLNEDAVFNIIEYVNNYQRMSISIEMALYISQSNDDYHIKSESTNKGINFVFEPKHINAPLNVLSIEEDKNLIEYANATGEKVSFEAKLRINPKIDQFIEKIFGEIVKVTYQHNIVRELFLGIQFLDEQDNVLVDFRFIRMSTVQAGTKLAVLEGRYNQLKFELRIDSITESIDFNPLIDIDKDDLDSLAETIKIFETIENYKTIMIKNLEKQSLPPLTFSRDEKVPLDIGVTLLGKRVIKALAIIKSRLNVPIKIPENFDNRFLNQIEILAEGLSRGYANELFDFQGEILTLSESSNNPQEFLSKITDPGDHRAKLPIKFEGNGVYILGHKVNIGQLFFEFSNLKILNLVDLMEKIAQSESGVLTTYEILFQIDRTNARTIFADWPKREEFEAALSQVADVEPIEGDEL